MQQPGALPLAEDMESQRDEALKLVRQLEKQQRITRLLLIVMTHRLGSPVTVAPKDLEAAEGPVVLVIERDDPVSGNMVVSVRQEVAP